MLCLILPTQAAQQSQITQVVNLLKDMLAKSKTDGDEERIVYAKLKCDCDTTQSQKEEEIASLTKDIDLLESEIEALQASSGVLSQQVAKLNQSMADNEASRGDAESLRAREANSWNLEYQDLSTAISQMNESIRILGEVSADQTLQTAEDHTQYMAGHQLNTNFISFKTSVKQALAAASAFVSPEKMEAMESFLQKSGSPFTGTYAAQSGEVVGILKDMFHTFIATRTAGNETEQKAILAHDTFMKHLEDAYGSMSTQLQSRQSDLSSNDGSLSSKSTQVSQARQNKESASTYLASLLESCAITKEEYNQRLVLRANEETALAEAISILNSDAAFATFRSQGTPSNFLQYKSVRRHPVAWEESPRRTVQAFLQRAAGSSGSPLLSRIVGLLQANNPFTVVLQEIDKMIALIAAEETADENQKQWCVTERGNTARRLTSLHQEITSLTTAIGDLKRQISQPETGLKDMISLAESNIKQNHENQAEQTAQRKSANLVYQESVANNVNSLALLKRAITVLQKYYSSITSDVSMLQKRELPTGQAPWGEYEGHSAEGGNAISMLESIKASYASEEQSAHEDEMTDQNEYEKSMLQLRSEESDLQTSLTTLQKSLAQASKQLVQKQRDLKETSHQKAKEENYLEDIKPGCDYIMQNIDARKQHRQTESSSLESAKRSLKASPAFTTAVEVAHNETLGDCLSLCADETHVRCKACLADTSVPGFCAGHPATDRKSVV